jgi:hypothetical protein
LHIGPSVTVTYAGAITLAGNASIQVDANSMLDMTNPLGISGSNKDLTFIADVGATASLSGNLDLAGGDLTKNGGGELIIDSDVTSVSSALIADGSLQVNSLHIDTLIVASGAKLIIRPISGGLSSGFMRPVPEPSTILLLLLAGTFTFAYCLKRRSIA